MVGRFEAGHPEAYEALLAGIKQDLRLPFYFTVPQISYLDLPPEISDSVAPLNVSSPAMLFNFRYTDPRRPIRNQLGLRLLVLDGSKPRELTSSTLAQTGLLETGDILLSFRPEWYGTLRYSHIQLGISHAGLAYVDQGKDGKPYVYNLDMPLDTDTVGADKKSRLSSKHYLEAPLVHVLRPRNLSPEQRRNLLKWLRLISQVAPNAYPTKIFFNKDYGAPKYRKGQPMKFVGDLGRIALELPISTPLSVYCSEFAWSVLALRNCDPVADAESFRSSDAPTCIEPIFQPLSVLGTFPLAKTDQDQQRSDLALGMADGPLVLVDSLISGEAGMKERSFLLHRLFSLANGSSNNISSGHLAVEKALLQANPKFYDMLESYYKMTGLPDPDANPAFGQIYSGFNASQFDNYPPASFQIHAVLPPFASVKMMDYVVTLAFAKPAQYQQLQKSARAH